MHAVEITETGGPDVLRNVEKPTPSPGPSEVLISITSTSTAPKAQLSREAGAASGPVPPVDTQRPNVAGSVYLTRPSRLHFIRTRDVFTWRTNQLFDAIATGTVKVNASAHYPLKDAAQAHRDLEGRRTVGRTDALTVT